MAKFNPPSTGRRTLTLRVTDDEIDDDDGDGSGVAEDQPGPFRNAKIGTGRSYPISLSSEEPVDQWFGREILDHSRGAVDLSRAEGMPLLRDHDPTQQIGAVRDLRIGRDRKLRGNIVFSKSAGDVEQDVADGIRTNMSVGYRVNHYDVEHGRAGEPDTYTATSWQPMEASIVSIPADHTVGVNRAASFSKGNRQMEAQDLSRSQRSAARAAAEQERERVRDISSIAVRSRMQDRLAGWIESGASVDEVNAEILEAKRSRPFFAGSAMGGDQGPLDGGHIGMTGRESRSFSISKAILGAVTGDWTKAGFERSAIEAAYKASGKVRSSEHEITIPTDVVWRVGRPGMTRSPYSTSPVSAGGALVETQLLAGEFVDVLRNKSVTGELGAKMISGLAGNVSLPRQATQSQAYWVAEDGPITESEATFDMVSLAPRTLGALSTISRQMLVQSTPEIDALVSADFTRVIALEIDRAALFGSGTNSQPLGIANQPGVNVYAVGANGDAATFDVMLAMKEKLLSANAPMEALGFAINPKTFAALADLKASTGQYLWNWQGIAAQGAPASIFGDRYVISNQLPSNGTAGTSSGICSTAIYGNWSELVIGMWSGPTILANPYDSVGFASGAVKLRIMQMVDVALRHPVSFCVAPNLLTAPF